MATDKAGDGGTGGSDGKAPALPFVHATDLWVASVVLAFCGAAYYLTTTFDEVSPLLAQNIPPEWFPRLLIWTIVVLTLILPFEYRFLEKGRAGLDKDRTEPLAAMLLLTAVLLSAAVYLIQWLGVFYTMIAVCLALPVLWGERRWKILIPYAIAFPIIVALVFTQFLKVYFEPGAFGLDLS